LHIHLKVNLIGVGGTGIIVTVYHYKGISIFLREQPKITSWGISGP